MIYFTTFILTLLLSHVARATPACGDVDSPEELYEPTYADAHQGQQPLPILFNVTWTRKYDDKNGDTKKADCSNLSHYYPYYKDFPHFPYIGGAWNIESGGSDYCGSCWNLTDFKTRKTISIAPIDHAKPGYYNISKESFNVLNGGKVGSTWLLAEAKLVDRHYCGFRDRKP
ncbi:hypothetical protein V8E52_000100 [Russula decolorans]|jgi:hypothetical protein